VAANAGYAGFLPTSAVDVALQSYSSRLLLAAAAPGDYGRAFDRDTSDVAQRDRSELGDFIELDPVALADDPALSMEAVGREQAAVDEVLAELHDLDSLPWFAMDANVSETGADDAVDDIELQLRQSSDAAHAGAALAAAEGGMLMLETRGNPNDSAFHLVESEAVAPDLLQARVGVEAAVGFYQAIDVATDAVPAANVSAVNNGVISTGETQELRQSGTDQAGQPTGGTSAAIGATFLGGLLWLARGGRSAVNAARGNHDKRQRQR
jgi:hypothetical protein